MEIKEKNTYNEEALENLLEFNFTSEENFDIDENYKHVLEFEEIQEKAKLSKEENIIDYLGSKYVEPTFYKKVNQLRLNLKAFFKKYDVNSPMIKDIIENDPNPEDDENLTKLFGVGKFILNTFNRTVEELNFVFRFSREEYNMVNDLINKKVEVNGQEVLLQGMDKLIEELEDWKNRYKNADKDQEELHLPLTIHSTFLMYHFLSKKVVKGFSNSFYTLRSVMSKLKDASDVFESYRTVSERMKSDFSIWVGAITPLNKKEEVKVIEELSEVDIEVNEK